MRKICLAISVLVSFSVYGCAVFQEIAGNSTTVFHTPSKVNNKIRNPYVENAKLALLWVGHSTCLIQMYDKLILTDPVLTETIGILSKRLVETGIEADDIPRLNLISISHPHIDHLSFGSLEMLSDKNKNVPLVFPEGMESYLPGYNFNYIRMKNGDTMNIDGIKVTAVTAKHWGGRYGIDGFLWGDYSYAGFIYRYKDLTVYFGGDTGYDSTVFKKIGERFDIDLALIPIGPCDECEGCGNKRHVFPEGAIKIFLDLRAKVMIPIHYGVFQFRLTDVNNDLAKLKELIKTYRIESSVKIPGAGEQVVLE